MHNEKGNVYPLVALPKLQKRF